MTAQILRATHGAVKVMVSAVRASLTDRGAGLNLHEITCTCRDIIDIDGVHRGSV